MTILTSNDVDNVRFTATQFREGYEQHEVDSFLEKIASTLRVLQAGTNSTGYASNIAGVKVLTADDVQSKKFHGTRFREGYEQDEVDSFTDGTGDAQYAEAIAQRDQYIAQLQQENAYLRAELEAAQRRSGMTGF